MRGSFSLPFLGLAHCNGLQIATSSPGLTNPAQQRGRRPNAKGGRPLDGRPRCPVKDRYRTTLHLEVTEDSPCVTRTR